MVIKYDTYPTALSNQLASSLAFELEDDNVVNPAMLHYHLAIVVFPNGWLVSFYLRDMYIFHFHP